MAAAALRLRDYLLLALLALALFIPGFSKLPPVDRDEARYAVASTQMLDSGDYVDVRFQDGPRYLQPAGIYWLQSVSAGLLTEPGARAIWAYRMPSLLAAIAAALLTAAIAAWLFGRKAGLAAGALLAACFSLGFEARIAKTDAALLVTIIVAQWALMRAYLDQGATRANAALFWAMIGVGAMIKGPIIIVVTGLTTGALCLWDRKAGWLKRLHAGWGVLIALAIAVPWYVAIGVISDGYFFTRSIGVNFLNKVQVGQQAHGGPPGYHTLLFALAFWPAALFAAFAAPMAWRERAKPEVRFLIAWIIPTWIAFEIAATKLPHYVLPTYPALAILAGAALFAAEPGKPGLGWRIAGGVFAALWLLASGALAALGPWVMNEFEGRLDTLAVALGAGGFLLAVATLVLLLRRSPALAVGAALASAAFIWNGLYGALVAAEKFWMSPQIVAAADAVRPCADDRTLISTPYAEPSLVFLNGYDQTDLVRNGAEAADALAAESACGVALIGQDRLPDFLARAAELGFWPRQVGSVAGQNYSDGEDMELTLFAIGGQPPGHEQP